MSKLKLYGGNEYAEVWKGEQRERVITHSKRMWDSRATVALELLKCVLDGGQRNWFSSEEGAVSYVCRLSELIHEECDKRGWLVVMPSPEDQEGENPVGFERRP